jgi:hypothetical protein
MSGMVIWADYYLLRHEKKIRRADDMMRRQARKGILFFLIDDRKELIREIDGFLFTLNHPYLYACCWIII